MFARIRIWARLAVVVAGAGAIAVLLPLPVLPLPLLPLGHRPEPPSHHSAIPCSETAIPAADLAQRIMAASPGSAVCFKPARWSSSEQVSLSHVHPLGVVTLQPLPGGIAHLGPLTLSDVSNLVVQGFALDGGVSVVNGATNLQFSHNFISGASRGFYFYGNGEQQSGIKLLSNRIDHVEPQDLSPPGAGQCVTVHGGAALEHHFTISGNRCGPGIANHYTQFGGIDGLVEDDNTFLGPAAAEALSTQKHNNVLQVFGSSDNIDFSHNLLDRTQARGQEVLIEEGRFSDVSISHNLFVGDPHCLRNNVCPSYADGLCAAEGLKFSYNTVVGYRWGVIVTNSLGGRTGCLPAGTNYRVTHNIVVGTTDHPDIAFAECSRSCAFDYNVTDDLTAAQDGSRHYVVRWRPHWARGGWFRPLRLPFPAGYAAAAPG